jgi:hypothetical protein
MGALALNQLLEKAQDRGIDLELETSILENQVETSQSRICSS